MNNTRAQIIDGDKLKKVIATMDENNPYYIELQGKLSEARKTLGLLYLYTMARDKNGHYIYLVDGLDPESEDFSQLGDIEEYEPYFKNFGLAMKGQVVKDDFALGDEWGNVVSSYIPIRDSSGNVVAFLGADLSADTILPLMSKNTISIVIVTFAVTLFGVIGALILSRRITSSITRLRDYSKKAVEGGFAHLAQSDEKDEIGELAAILENRIDAVRTILDNTGQGFLTFRDHFLVNSEYSTECRSIFGKNIEGSDFLELIYPDNVEQRKFIRSVLETVLKENNKEKREVYFSLLSEEIVINGMHILVEYKIISGKSGSKELFMAILTDITERRLLENRVEHERDVFRMVVKIIANHDDFLECSYDYNEYFEEGIKAVVAGNKRLADKVYDIFKSVHTFRGNLGQLYMAKASDSLQKLETKLSDFANNVKIKTLQDLMELIEGFDYKSGFEADIALLNEVLGEDYVKSYIKTEKGFVIDKSKLIAIEKKMQSILSPLECRVLLPEIQKLRFKPFRDLLKSYPDYVARMAEKLGKKVWHMEITGGEFSVDVEKYRSLTKSLIHVFRNAVDHGIEPAEERLDAAKDEYGRVQCSIAESDGKIQIKIIDDGYGINTEEVRRKAVEKGIVSADAAAVLTDKEILDIIFTDGFSTRQEATEFSGRGVGLSAILNEVKKLDREIAVSTKAGSGTEFCITFPVHETAGITDLAVDGIMGPLFNTIGGFIKKQLGENINAPNICNIEKTDKIRLNKYTAFIDIKGVLEGRFALSLDRALSQNLASKMVIGFIPGEQKEDIVEDTVSECLNIALGNSIKLLRGLEELVMLSTPVTINSEDTVIRHPECDIWTCSAEFESGQLSLSFIVPQGLL
ncbi:MAG: chemotaxis protein CheX [Caulobacteraceae bacterium]